MIAKTYTSSNPFTVVPEMINFEDFSVAGGGLSLLLYATQSAMIYGTISFVSRAFWLDYPHTYGT